MTDLYFVRHAQPDYRTGDNATFALSDEGMTDRMIAFEALKGIEFDYAISSPYRRSLDTIRPCAENQNLTIMTDDRLRERDSGIKGNSSYDMFRKRWSDFSFHEEGGESLLDCQNRNIEAIFELIKKYSGMTLLIGTHGTSLSTIINYFDDSFGFEAFMRIVDFMPYVVHMRFDNEKYCGYEELAFLHKEFHGKK